VKKKSGSNSFNLISAIPAPCAPSMRLMTLYSLQRAINYFTGKTKEGMDEIKSKIAIFIFLLDSNYCLYLAIMTSFFRS